MTPAFSSYRLLCTGTRKGRPDTVAILDAHIAEHGRPYCVVVCGDWNEKTNKPTFRGVDKQARDWATARKLSFIEILAFWHMHKDENGNVRGEGNPAGPERNINAVWHCGEGDHCVAIPDPTGPSKGTRGCAAVAKRAGLEVFMHEVSK